MFSILDISDLKFIELTLIISQTFIQETPLRKDIRFNAEKVAGEFTSIIELK